MRFEFIVRSGREMGRQISVSTGQALTFGRLKTCDVQVEDEAVSRRHCTLHAHETNCVVADLQSANGTFVNEQRISTIELKPGDQFRLGSTIFESVAPPVPATDRPTMMPMPTASFRVTAEERGHTLIRKSVDPNKLDFLSQVINRKDDQNELLESAQRYLSTLHKVSDVLSRAIGVEALFDSILMTIIDVTGGERAAILMKTPAANGAEGDVQAVAVRTAQGKIPSSEIVLSLSVVRDVLDDGISTFSHDALTDSRYGAGESIVRQQIRSVMCAPMRTTDAILGVLYVDSQSSNQFSEAELELLAAIGNQAGVALHRARLLDEVERMFLDVTKAIAAIIDAKDGYTHRHSERVAKFAVRLASELGLTADNLDVVELSALLHDVGKIGVPDAILNKPDKLTDEEFAEMKRHPVHGASILANIKSRKVIALLPGVKYHHEKWDGSGYPEGLTGENIPLLGRILAVADFLDALSSDRAYHKGSTISDVVDMVKGRSGRSFDPAVVDALVRLHEKGELSLPVEPGVALR